MTNARLATVNSTTDIDAIEEAIGAGQIEQVAKQATDELSLAQKMTEWKPWEPLEEAPLAGQWKFP
jgi:NADH dehydrogenase (ubiquinone) 1 alpha subcomplex subunit 5